MAFKLRTSKRAEEIISVMESSENLACYTLVKLAMALSLRSNIPLTEKELATNTLGRELNRQTITGDADALYKCLVEMNLGKHITDEEFFPKYVKAHIDRGMLLLEKEKRYASDLLAHLSNLDDAI